MQRLEKIKHVDTDDRALGAMINLGRAREWLGRVDVRADQIAPAPLAALFATLDREEAAPGLGDPAPPLAHWLYFLAPQRNREIGADGAERSSFLPPIELPLRACTESRIQIHRPLRVGEAVTRLSRIVDIAVEPERVGQGVTVLVRNEIGDGDGVALSEDQRIAFRPRPGPAAIVAAGRARAASLWSRRYHADEKALFRYSALTFDACRVHYDRPFATFVEGHPGLVVQTGLVAMLLMDLLRRHAPGAEVASCSFRSMRALYDVEPFHLFGRPTDARTVELWAEDAEGSLAMEAEARLSEDAAFGRPIIGDDSARSARGRPFPRNP
jgi:3-methylfumaryl-CoA hydratase